MKKHLLLPIVILLLLSLFQACTDQDQAIEPEQPNVEIVLLTENSHLQNLMGKINQQGSMNGRSNSILDEVNFERAMKRFNPETGNTHYSFSMHSDSGLTLHKFILSENSENEISGHVFEYEVDADWLAEVEIFPGWHQYNGYFRILDLDEEVIAENEIVAGSSVSKESSNGRSSRYICITTTRRIGWVGVHPDYMGARYETTTNCFTITNRGTPAPTGGGSGLLQISQEVGFLTSSRDDFPLNTCSADNTKYENGTCVCINGYIKDENDNCVSRLPCVAGYVRDRSGSCIEINLNMDAQGYQELTSCEKALLRSNPLAGITLQSNANLANAKTQEIFGFYINGNGHNDCGDAFRHAYFNALNTLSWSDSYAKKWGDAHECETPLDLGLEKSMDLHNNAIGRSVANQAPNISKEALVDLVLVELEVGHLNFLKPLDKLNNIISGVTQETIATNCL